MSKHTPGPWRLINGLIRCPEGSCVLDADDANMREADAVLVTAAPDLLEALRELVSQVQGYQDCNGDKGFVVTDAIAAIAKATGEQA